MFYLNGYPLKMKSFPDGTFAAKVQDFKKSKEFILTWMYDSDKEIADLYYIANHLKTFNKPVSLYMPYCPNARMDKTKTSEEVFTLKYFAKLLNSLNFKEVIVLDPHSDVTQALIDRCKVNYPVDFIRKSIELSSADVVFYPDDGARKRYMDLINFPSFYGFKRRDCDGKLISLEVACKEKDIRGKNILIVDDICSRGGTFYLSASRLKELGVKDISLWVTHCEETVLNGALFQKENKDLIKHIYTTDSIFKKTEKKITIFPL